MKRSDYYGLQASIYAVGTVIANKPWSIFMAILVVFNVFAMAYCIERERT